MARVSSRVLPLAVAGVVVHLKFQGGEETVDQTVVLDEPVLNWKERLRGSGIVHAPACAVQIQFGGQEISSVGSLREHGVEAGAVLHCTVTSAFRLFFCTSMYIQQHHTEFSAGTMAVCSSYHAECEIEACQTIPNIEHYYRNTLSLYNINYCRGPAGGGFEREK